MKLECLIEYLFFCKNICICTKKTAERNICRQISGPNPGIELETSNIAFAYATTAEPRQSNICPCGDGSRIQSDINETIAVGDD